ncbi:hypothetical protein L2E82_08692 [Cichorium intybus]|uniref:Uncharacterized protein n=1 Tax=Cichorium intybus TaxID=13427 RepID=A0ACB9G6U5_CICIN|nr:hypothetical protein L2E82_08692 [Cichorium intybus]
MKKAFDQTFRDIKREVNIKVLQVSAIEQKVLEATSNEPWDPPGIDLVNIAEASRNYQEYQMIMPVVWKRLNDTGKNWRHVYKGLRLLEFLVSYGSERVIDDIREHAYQLTMLSDFQYIDSSGMDQGSNVRKKSQHLVALVNDKEKIDKENLQVREQVAARLNMHREAPPATIQPPPAATTNDENKGFSFFDPRSSSPAAVPATATSASGGAEMDLVGSQLDAFSSNPSALVPSTSVTTQVHPPTNSNPFLTFDTTSPPLIQDVEHLRIPLQNLNLATNNFSKEYVIAKGGFGLVYKAQNEHGTIALKKLDQRFGQGDREFMMEIAMLSAYTHQNLVSLVGFCDEGDEKILVYKHEINGSLDQHLHRKDLTWIQRLQICLDVAQGLKYLHNDIGAQHRILHRDMKSSNILLDENFRAKISDFGLSKIALANVPCSALISKVCGTPGYVDPEYYKYGILTQKSDVYSFGVVLFEVLCGKLVGVSKHLGEPFSAELPQNCYDEGTLDEIIDSDLRNQMNSASLATFSAIAHQCLKLHGRDRPTMSVVVEEIKKALVYQQVVSPG